jgi:hypothetical protein
MKKQKQAKSIVDSKLVQAYSETIFHVFNPSIAIRIDAFHPKLDQLLIKKGKSQWAFITPYNPASIELKDEENRERLSQLVADLKKYSIHLGEGRGTDPRWKPEQSVLILGISPAKAKRLGKQYGQYAIVTGSRGCAARLVMLQ